MLLASTAVSSGLLFLLVLTSGLLLRSKVLKHFCLLEQKRQPLVCTIGLQSKNITGQPVLTLPDWYKLES